MARGQGPRAQNHSRNLDQVPGPSLLIRPGIAQVPVRVSRRDRQKLGDLRPCRANLGIGEKVEARGGKKGLLPLLLHRELLGDPHDRLPRFSVPALFVVQVPEISGYVVSPPDLVPYLILHLLLGGVPVAVRLLLRSHGAFHHPVRYQRYLQAEKGVDDQVFWVVLFI